MTLSDNHRVNPQTRDFLKKMIAEHNGTCSPGYVSEAIGWNILTKLIVKIVQNDYGSL